MGYFPERRYLGSEAATSARWRLQVNLDWLDKLPSKGQIEIRFSLEASRVSGLPEPPRLEVDLLQEIFGTWLNLRSC
jgi:hypothetical protein